MVGCFIYFCICHKDSDDGNHQAVGLCFFFLLCAAGLNFFQRDVMVSEALPVQHSRAFDSQRFATEYPAAVRMQEEHCGFPSRFVLALNINADMTCSVLTAATPHEDRWCFRALFLVWLFTSHQNWRPHLSFSRFSLQNVFLNEVLRYYCIWNSKLKPLEILICRSGFVLFYLSFVNIYLIYFSWGHCALLVHALTLFWPSFFFPPRLTLVIFLLCSPMFFILFFFFGTQFVTYLKWYYKCLLMVKFNSKLNISLVYFTNGGYVEQIFLIFGPGFKCI